jgi:hypothetical protein
MIINGQSTQQFFTIKQNRPYSVKICFYLRMLSVFANFISNLNLILSLLTNTEYMRITF